MHCLAEAERLVLTPDFGRQESLLKYLHCILSKAVPKCELDEEAEVSFKTEDLSPECFFEYLRRDGPGTIESL